MKYAITAATGKFGQTAVTTLINSVNSDDQIVAIVRNTERAKSILPEEVEIRQADYGDAEQMEAVLQDVDRLLFISSQPGGQVTREQQHQNVVTAVKNAGVAFVAYTSFPNAQKSQDPLAADHKITENLIGDAGLSHSFLRNNWYLENEIGFIQSGNQNQIAAYWANNRAGWALEREYAEAAAKVLMMQTPNDVYEFAGPANSYADLGIALKQATGNDFAVEQVTRTDYVKGLEATGMNADLAAMFASFQEPIDDGALNEETVDLPTVLGHNLTSLPDAIEEILKRN